MLVGFVGVSFLSSHVLCVLRVTEVHMSCEELFLIDCTDKSGRLLAFKIMPSLIN